ncbi:acyltransferase family protein [Chitinophaga tropicalis]|uniref:Acyltransferase family protein n=1 Tax=Chitinophaga tropicalis TaxID=2683588 RepID=A0A7K1U0A5_9BACT|nr:acyltransferase [Chitinophaga tropicalis]MVT07801.1 acyltransferase family protein [Chitinophaga tropicalis]
MSDKRLNGLDHLRALAIILVFLFHYGRLFPSPQWVTAIGAFGWTGVDLFFVLSGYLIASQLFSDLQTEDGISFKDFFLKRFFRIVPAYLFTVAVYFLLPSFREREAPAPLWKYLTFTQNLGLDLRYQGTFSHAWSLCIEEQFYLLLPLVLILLSYFRLIKRGWILLLILFLGGFFIRAYNWHYQVSPFIADGEAWINWYKWIYYPTFTRLDGLLTGIFIAGVFQFRPALKERISRYGNGYLLLSIFILAAAWFVCTDTESFHASVYGFTLTDLGYGVMVLGAVSNTSILYKFRLPAASRLAILSYAIYLLHKITIHLTQLSLSKLHIEKDSNLMFVLCIITSVLAGLILNLFIEKPFLRLRNKLFL